MFDAWSSFPQNYTHGNSYDFGNFDLCAFLKIDNVMRTRYCLVQYFYNSSKEIIPVQPSESFANIQWKNLNERFGGAICVPDSCNVNDVKKIINGFFNGSSLVYADDYDQGNFCKGASDEINWMIIFVIV